MNNLYTKTFVYLINRMKCLPTKGRQTDTIQTTFIAKAFVKHYNFNQFVVNTHIQRNNCLDGLELFRVRCKYCSGCKLNEN